jgi:hypothetical protein
VSLIVAVSMKRKFVAQFLTTPFTLWGDVIYLNNVFILKEQATPPAFSLLFLEPFSQ